MSLSHKDENRDIVMSGIFLRQALQSCVEAAVDSKQRTNQTVECSLVPRPSASSAPCALRVIIKCGGGRNGGRRPGRIYHVIRALSDVTLRF